MSSSQTPRSKRPAAQDLTEVAPATRSPKSSARARASADESSAKRKRTSAPKVAAEEKVRRTEGDLVECDDGKMRCKWATSTPDYIKCVAYTHIHTLPHLPSHKYAAFSGNAAHILNHSHHLLTHKGTTTRSGVGSDSTQRTSSMSGSHSRDFRRVSPG